MCWPAVQYAGGEPNIDLYGSQTICIDPTNANNRINNIIRKKMFNEREQYIIQRCISILKVLTPKSKMFIHSKVNCK